MGKLNDSTIVNSINSEYVLLTDSNGMPVRISKSNFAEAIRSVMSEANTTNKGLMPAGILGTKNVQSSVLLFESNNFAITGSILLSISRITGGMPNLYFIRIVREGGSTDNPTLRVKVLAGTYEIKIKAKTDADGKCRVYAERLQYTPVLDAFLLNSVGIFLKMETADNSAFEGGFEATLE